MSGPDCPDPAHCPVADYASLTRAKRVDLPARLEWRRCYDSTWGFDEPNPGKGDTCFAPFRDASGAWVPTMYLADNDAGALLETVFHDVAPGVGAVYEVTLRNYLLARVSPPRDLRLVDLRDTELARLGVPRTAVVSSSAEHYACTRLIAAGFYDDDPDIAGLLWDSRQSELRRAGGRPMPASAVAVIFSTRVTSKRGGWARPRPGVLSLTSGAGRTLIDEIADALGVDVITS
jgi:hypothetical protein